MKRPKALIRVTHGTLLGRTLEGMEDELPLPSLEPLLPSMELRLLSKEAFRLSNEPLMLSIETLLSSPELHFLDPVPVDSFCTEIFLLTSPGPFWASPGSFFISTESFLLSLEPFLVTAEPFWISTEPFLVSTEAFRGTGGEAILVPAGPHRPVTGPAGNGGTACPHPC